MITVHYQRSKRCHGSYTASGATVHLGKEHKAAIRQLASPEDALPGIPRLAAQAETAGRLVVAGGLTLLNVDPATALEMAAMKDLYHTRPSSAGRIFTPSTALQAHIANAPRYNPEDSETQRRLEVIRLGLSMVALAQHTAPFSERADHDSTRYVDSVTGRSRIQHYSLTTNNRIGTLAAVGLALRTSDESRNAGNEVLEATHVTECRDDGTQHVFQNTITLTPLRNEGPTIVEYTGAASTARITNNIVDSRILGGYGLFGVAGASASLLLHGA